MAWEGYFEFGGVEFVNVDRTEAYAAHANVGWFKPLFRNGALAPMLGDGPAYNSPLQDDAPWTDPDQPASYGFYGAYPLEVTGIEDSTVTATVTESTIDGGVVGSTRRTTRTMVFSLALLGADECSVEYGMRWLKSVFTGGPCFGGTAADCTTGSNLCFLACPPMLDDSPSIGVSDPFDPTDCLDPLLRSLHKVAVTVGPNVTGKRTTTSGGCVWTVSLTLVAGNPAEFGTEVPLIAGFGDPKVGIPYVGGQVPPGGSYDINGHVQTEQACPVPVFTPVVDPACFSYLPPPPAPNIQVSCFDFPVNYKRRQFAIPGQYVPLWGTTVPTLYIHAVTAEVRSLRLRFYADPQGDGSLAQDPCAFCGDIVFSYIPKGLTLVFDGVDRQVYLLNPGGARQRADHLVFGSDGTPFDWPELTCGYGYVVAVDLPQTAVSPVLDLNLSARAV
jgi:hypothetical protein